MSNIKNKDTRTFSVAPNIIYSLIKAQAGSLAKAVLECVMNSIDAGATHIDVECDIRNVIISDDGPGFKTKDEIVKCFEVFGFEHKEGDRIYGQFGIGRAQLWNFCFTKWRTNWFQMDVDIKNRGLDYDLVSNLSKFDGLEITGTFYEELSATELISFEREFEELVLFAQIPVMLNGEIINKDPSLEKWTHETNDAWIKINDTGTLDVYNLGVLVRKYPGYTAGCGGIVVTKSGVRLALNMARNDILTSECKVWKRIKPFLQNEMNRKQKTINWINNEQMRHNVIMRYQAGELDEDTFYTAKVVMDIFGKVHTLEELAVSLFYYSYRPISVAEPGTILAERIHKNGMAFILNPKMFGYFRVNSVKGFVEKLWVGTKSLIKGDNIYSCYKFNPKLIFENYRDICPGLSDKHILISDKDWTVEEGIAIFTLREISGDFEHFLNKKRIVNSNVYRSICLGASDVSNAWTDGERYIYFDRETIKFAKKGLAGWQVLLSILLHEYLHEEPSSETHAHDYEFYRRFHDAMMILNESDIDFLQRAYQKYISLRRRNKLPLTKKSTILLDALDYEIIS